MAAFLNFLKKDLDIVIYKQSQFGTQFGGCKKQESQFLNIDCGVYTQNALNGSSFSNRGGHVSSQLGALGIPMSNMGIPTHRSVNQTFIVNKKRGIISEGECPSHNIT